MAYEGELLTYCPQDLDFSRTYAVVVSGASLNRFGHMLLNTGGANGTYFQVAGAWATPRFMNEEQFQRYLKENGKFVITVTRVDVPFPQKAQAKLEELLSKPWVWGGLVHNCESMVQTIVTAGGGASFPGLLPLPINSTDRCSNW